MEGFLSLPRSAKGGLAVLLAVALLGWAMVAYSAMRQHDEARNLQNARATLESLSGREAEAAAELQSLQQRLSAAEDELTASREAAAASRQERSDIETALAEREADLAALRERLDAAAPAEGGALTLLDSREGGDAEEAGDTESLRARLTETMTALSARNATLQQKERELSQARTAADEAAGEIETFVAAATERDALRERLTRNMTTLSARNATVQQKEREIAALRAELDEAAMSLDAMTSASADQEAAGRSLDDLTAKLERTRQALSEGAESLEKNQQALADQQARLQELERQQASVEAAIAEKDAEAGQQAEILAARQEELVAAEAELARLESAREDGMAESSSLTAELDGLQASLAEKEDALALAETELSRLEDEIAAAETELAEINDELDRKRSMLSAQDVEVQGVEASLAALKADRAVAEAEAIELKTAINRQQDALDDLAALKGEIEEAKAELAVQTALLDERRQEAAAAGDRLQGIRQASTDPSAPAQTLPTIAIADLSRDNPAVLPIDPMQTPMPVQTERGIRLTLVHFDLGSAELTPGAMRRAKEAAGWIKQLGGDDKIRVIGATDTIGTRENNLALAERRAQSLLKVFADEGIDPDRIEVISMGEAGGSERIADQTAEPLNRCVGVFIGG